MADSDRAGPTVDRGSAAGPGLSITHDPGKRDIYAFLICLAICLAFATPFGYAFFVGDYGPHDDPSEDYILFTGFLLGSIVLAGLVIRAARGRSKKLRTYRLEGGEILCLDGRGLLWREPAKAYRQVRWHEEQHSYVTKYGRQYYTAQVITLDHPQTERCIDIFAHQDQATPELQASCQRWSAALGLPIMREEGGQAVKRSAMELEKPLRDLASEGRLAGGFDTSEEPPKGIAWGQSGPAVWIRARTTFIYALFVAPTVLLAGLSATFEAGSFLPESESMIVPFIVLALVLVLATFAFQQTVLVSGDEVTAVYRFLGLPLWRSCLPIAGVLRIYRSEGIISDGVVLLGREGTIRLLFIAGKTAHRLVEILQSAIVTQDNGNLPGGAA